MAPHVLPRFMDRTQRHEIMKVITEDDEKFIPPNETYDCVDDLGRHPLHYAAMCFDTCDVCNYEGCLLYCKCCLDFFGFDGLQVKDRYERTHWHYAYMNGYKPTKNNRRLFPADLIDEDSKDCFGYSPYQLFECRLRGDETKPIDELIEQLQEDIENKCDKFLSQFTDDQCEGVNTIQVDRHWTKLWELWSMYVKNGLLEDTTKLSDAVYNDTTNFVRKLVDAIGRKDPRLRGRLLEVGSAYEKTRLRPWYEFDFNVVLELSEVCEVVEPTTDTAVLGFVVVKRKDGVDCVKLKLFEDFFDTDGRLNVKKVNFSFQSTMIKVLSWQQFREEEDLFEMIYDYSYGYLNEVNPNKLVTCLYLQFNKLFLDKYIPDAVSIDIVHSHSRLVARWRSHRG